MSKVQAAVKKETGHVALYTGIGTVIMWIVIFILNKAVTEKVPFDATVFVGGIGGTIVAVLNFFLMGLTVQKVASEEDDSRAKNHLKLSYMRRSLLQIAWIVISLVAGFIYWPAGILPLIFPSAGIKIKGIFDQIKYNRQEVERKQDGN